MNRRGWVGSLIVAGGLALAALPAGRPGLAGEPKAGEPRADAPGLWIAADRVVGFVPFTVYVYGKVRGPEPSRIELCRSEIAWIAESSSVRMVEPGRAGGRDPGDPGDRDSTRTAARVAGPAGGRGAECGAGKMKRSPDGYDFTHDLRFDRPGTYQVRLMMIGAGGRRTVSNTVRVSAF